MAEDLISKYIFKAEGINEVKAQAAQLGGYLQAEGQKGGAAFSKSFKSNLSAQNFGKMAGTLAAGAVAAAPIALAAGLAHATSVAAGFEQSMANVASVTGGGADSMAHLSEVAREAGASSVFSASEAGGAMYYLASAGMNADQISASLGDTLNLAAAGGMGLADATEIVTSTLSQYNMGAEEAGRVSNVLAAAAAGSNTTIGQMGAGMSYAGPLANALGISLEDTSAAMMVLANAGIKGERGGTALRGVLSSLMDISPKAAEALEGMGLSAEDLDPSLHSIDEIMATLRDHGMTSADAVKIFGRESSSAAIKLVEGADDINKFSDSITGTNKASQMATTQTETFQGAMKMLGSAVEEAEIALGTVFLPVLTSGVQKFTEGVRWATEFGSSVYEMGQNINSALEPLGGIGGIIDSLTISPGEVKEAWSYLTEEDGLSSDIRSWADGQDWLTGYLENYDEAKARDIVAQAGEESGEEFAEGMETGTEDIPENIEKTLEEVDAEGAGKDAGKSYSDAFIEEFVKGSERAWEIGIDHLAHAGDISSSYIRDASGDAISQIGADWKAGGYKIGLELNEGLAAGLEFLPTKNENYYKVLLGSKTYSYDVMRLRDELIASDKLDEVRLDVFAVQKAIQEYAADTGIELDIPLSTIFEWVGDPVAAAEQKLRELYENISPYEKWGSPQHMVSKFQEYRDTIEPELIANVYAMENNLREEGKVGWEQAWADILDPTSTEGQIEAALEVLQLDDYGLELVDRIRRGMDFSGVYIDFADEMKKIAQEGADVFSDNFLGEDEAQEMIDRYTWAMTQDPAAFEEAGGKTALQYWEGLQAELDKLEAMITAKADPSQITAQRELIAQIIGDHPYQIQVEAEVNAFGGPLAVGPVDEDGNLITLASLLFGTDADRHREIERDDLWWRNEVMPLMEDHIDKMLAAATSGYADDYVAAKKNAERLYRVQDTYGDMMTSRQNQLISDLRSGEIGIMEFNELWDNVETSVDDVGKSVDELSDKYGNLAKTTAEAGDDCCEAMSEFGKAHEASTDMFFGSYIGPTENYVPWLAETGEYDKRISVGFDFPDDIDQQVAEYLNAHPVDAEIETSLKEGTIENDVILPLEEAEAIVVPGADLNQDDLYNIVTEINTTETAIPVGLNATQFWNEYMSIVTRISNWTVYIPVDVSVVANIPALASQIKAEILAGIQS